MYKELIDWADLGAVLVLARTLVAETMCTEDETDESPESPIEAALCCIEEIDHDRIIIRAIADALRESYQAGFLRGAAVHRQSVEELSREGHELIQELRSRLSAVEVPERSPGAPRQTYAPSPLVS